MVRILSLITWLLTMGVSAHGKLDCSNAPRSKYNYKISLADAQDGQGGLIINRSVAGKYDSSLLDDTGYLSAFYIKEYLISADNDSNVNASKYEKSLRLMRLQLDKLRRSFLDHPDKKNGTAKAKVVADMSNFLNKDQIDKGELYMKWAAFDKEIAEYIETARMTKSGDKYFKERTGFKKLSEIDGLPFEEGKKPACAISVSEFDSANALDVILSASAKVNSGLRQDADSFFSGAGTK